jgi:hypothetical protein
MKKKTFIKIKNISLITLKRNEIYKTPLDSHSMGNPFEQNI